MILIHALLLAWTAVNNSVTVDEYAHLPAGIAYWKHAEFSIYNTSPPLLRMWAAAPVMAWHGMIVPAARPLRYTPSTSRYWVYAERFMEANLPDYRRIFDIARLAMIPLSCWAAWVVWRWAGAMYGPRAGLVSCALYCFDPNFLAHASLVTTDAGTAAAVITSAWLWWRFCRKPHTGRLVWAAVAFAAALLCKFTTLFLIPALAIVTVLFLYFRPLRPHVAGAALLATALVSLLLINLTYGYHGSFQQLRSYKFHSEPMRRWTSHLPGWLPVPLPDFFVEGFDAMEVESGPAIPGFALGESYTGSRWYYYPLTLVCKLPIVSLAILFLTFASILVAPLRFHEWILLIVAATFFFGTAALGGVNIGVRHVLPVLPALYILAGRLWVGRSWLASGVIAMAFVALLALEVIPTGPNFIAFFNRAVGGPQRGQFLLNDSNFDWGQGLWGLKNWMQSNHVDHVTLAYFGRADPRAYGIAASSLADGIDSEYVGISSHFYVGMGYRLRSASGDFTEWMQLSRPDLWQRLRPVAVIDQTLRIYRRQDVQSLQAESAAPLLSRMPTAQP